MLNLFTNIIAYAIFSEINLEQMSTDMMLDPQKNAEELLEQILDCLPRNIKSHIPGSDNFVLQSQKARQAIETLFSTLFKHA